MIRSLLLALPCAGLVLSAPTLNTDYSRDRSLRVESTVHVEIDTTSEMERDGQPVENRFGGDSSLELDRKVVQVDTVLEHEGTTPKRVKRVFENVSSQSKMSMGDRDMDDSFDGPLSGVTLEVSMQDGKPQAEVVDGDQPQDDAVLEGHVPTLRLDAFLPAEGVEPGASWDLDGDAIVHGLSLDLQPALFWRPAPDEDDAGGGGGGRGGRGRRGGGPGRGGVSFLDHSDWSGTAKLEDSTEEHDGLTCAVIDLKLEGEGEMPEQEFRGGGRGRDRAFSPAAAAALPFDNHHEVKLEGKLLWSKEEARPVLLELEGSVHTSSSFEGSRGDSSFSMTRSGEGSIEIHVAVGNAPAQDKKDE